MNHEVWVKICGLTREEDVEAAVAAGADAVGLILVARSPRRITEKRAAELAQLVAGRSQVVLLVEGDVAEAVASAVRVGADVVQPYGPAAAAIAAAALEAGLAALVPVAVEAGAIPDTSWVPEGARPLLETSVGGQMGGTGAAFDWAAARAVRDAVVAGGLDEENVARAVREGRPWGVDASSGLETEVGVKDHGKVSAFIGAAKAAKGAPLSIQHPPNDQGRFGDYGGRFAPEILMPALIELDKAFHDAWSDPAFKAEFDELLANFVGRPTPVFRASRLSDQLGIDLWLKREDLAHTGAHKINNTVGQALLAKRMGKPRVIAETGAGQHGVATATACALLGLDCVVYMGAKDIERQALNVYRMRLLQAEVVSVEKGAATLKDAVSEAMRDWVATVENTHYIIGSVVGPHPFPLIVREFQKVIGEELQAQMNGAAGRPTPDVIVACVGGGSNSMGIFHPYRDAGIDLVGVEAAGHGIASGAHGASLVAGSPGVLHGSRTYMLQDEQGQVLEAHSISAGLDYPGVGPEHSYYRDTGIARYVAITDDDALAALKLMSATEGIIPALESAHGLAWIVAAADELRGKTVVLNLSGRGDKDVQQIEKFGD